MVAHPHVGAAAPGPVTPESDNARRQPGVIDDGQGEVDGPDCADQPEERKLIATAIARAALLGWEVRPIEGSAWQLVRTVRGAALLCATVATLEAACCAGARS